MNFPMGKGNPKGNIVGMKGKIITAVVLGGG
jgi:hypothetical protein